MIGAIVGDIAGSPYEFDNIKTKDFPLFSRRSRPTDDSIMTLAVARALLDAADNPAALPSAAVTGVTHNHPEGLKGARATTAAIAGAVAEAHWGVPDALRAEAWTRLDGFLRETVEAFEARFFPGRGL